LFDGLRTRSVLPFDLQIEESEMASDIRSSTRQGEAFWRAHHEAWKRSDLNQRQYCEAEGIPLKAFGNWRAKFKAEPQPPERKLLYRRRGFPNNQDSALTDILINVVEAMDRDAKPVATVGQLKAISQCRRYRNLVAHFAAERFPGADVFVFASKNDRDALKVLGRTARASSPLRCGRPE
jgi:hypothetical protein